MFKKLLKKVLRTEEKIEQDIAGRFITAQLNDKIMPIDRGDVYEDPLDEFLKANDYGEVTGGGTMQAQNGEIEFCDLEVLVYEGNDLHNVIKAIIEKLEAWGAPKGSCITVEDTEQQIEFGKLEGLAVYLNGADLPEHVYQECDSNFVLSELSRLIGYEGIATRYWQGATETALYFYGESFDTMNTAITDFINTYPLCQGARIVKIA